MTLRQLREQVKRLVRDDASSLDDPADFNNAIAAALCTYSLLRPRAVTQTVNTGTNYLLMTSTITNFDVGNVEKMLFEYPVVDTYARPIYIDRSTWQLYQSTDGLAIRFNNPPSSTVSIRVTHAIAHILPVDGNGDPDDDSTMTPITSDLDAIANESAGASHEMLASKYTDTVGKAPQVEFAPSLTTRTQEHRTNAKMFHKLFADYMEASLGQGRGSFKVVRS